MPFRTPNYTQTPNDLFDSLLAELGNAELRVCLALIRLTFGYHRKSVRASLTKIANMTGMTRESVLVGAAGLEEKGLILKMTDGGVTIYELAIDQELVGVSDQLVGLPDQSGRGNRPPTIKETVKENELNNIGSAEPVSGNKLIPETDGSFFLFNLITDEQAAKNRRPPLRFPTLQCKQKFQTAEERLGGIELERAIKRAVEKSIVSITGITDFVSKWNSEQPKPAGSLQPTPAAVDYEMQAIEARKIIEAALQKEN